MEVQLINLDTNVSLTFDTKNFILNEIIHDNCVVQHNTSKTIKQIGEYVKSTNVNSRTINITGTAIGQSELDLSNKKQILLNLTSPFSSIKIILDNKFTLTGKCQSLVKWGVGHDNNNRYFVKFSIDILAPNTLWYALEPTIVSLSPYVNEFKFPISIPESGFIYGHKDNDTLTNIYNDIKIILDNKFTLTGKCQSLVKWGVGHDNNNRYFVKFSIDILAPNTLWYALEPTIVSLSPYVNEFKFPISIPESGFIYGHKDNDTLTNIYNECNVPIPISFTITSLAAIENPEVIRVQDGKRLRINTIVQPGDVLTITTEFGSKSVTLNGENIISDFDFQTSSWLMLQPGLNTFTYSCADAANKENLNVNVTYTQAYWGVF